MKLQRRIFYVTCGFMWHASLLAYVYIESIEAVLVSDSKSVSPFDTKENQRTFCYYVRYPPVGQREPTATKPTCRNKYNISHLYIGKSQQGTWCHCQHTVLSRMENPLTINQEICRNSNLTLIMSA